MAPARTNALSSDATDLGRQMMYQDAAQRLDKALEKAASQMIVEPDPEDYDDASVTLESCAADGKP